MRCGCLASWGGYCGVTWKFEVWIDLSGMPSRFNAANTAFMLRLVAARASAALRASLTTPADRIAWSGLAFTSPMPLTTSRCGKDCGADWASAGSDATQTAINAANPDRWNFMARNSFDRSKEHSPSTAPRNCGDRSEEHT